MCISVYACVLGSFGEGKMEGIIFFPEGFGVRLFPFKFDGGRSN